MWVRCRRRFFFPEKRAPYFWKPLACGYVAAGAFFSTKKGPIFLEALLSRTARIHQIWARIIRARHGNIWHGTDHQGTARKYLARHGSTRSGHGTARDVPAMGYTRPRESGNMKLKHKISEQKSVLPNLLARSRLVEAKTSRPHVGSISGHFFHRPEKCNEQGRPVPCQDLVDPCRAKYVRAVPL